MNNENENLNVTEPSVDNTPVVEDSPVVNSSPVVEETPTTNQYTYGSSGDFDASFRHTNKESGNFSGVKAPSGGKNKFIIPLVIIGVLALGATAVFALKDTITNAIMKNFASPSEYYKTVVGGDFDESIDAYVEAYEESYKLLDSGKFGSSVSAKVELGDELSALLESLSPEIASLKSAEIGIKAGLDDNSISESIFAKINDAELLTFNAYVPNDASQLYVQIPEIKDAYISAPLEMTESDAAAFTDAMSLLTSADMMPDPELLKNILTRYSDVYFDYLIAEDIVEKETVNLEVCDVSQECTALSYTLDGDNLCDLAIEMLKTAEDDDDIDELISGMLEPLEEISGESLGYDADTMYDSISEAIDSVKEMKKTAKEYKNLFTLVTYIGDNGDVLGYDLTIEVEDEEVLYISSAMAINGGNMGYNFELTADGTTYVTIDGNGSSDFSDISAEFEVCFSDGNENYYFDVDVENCDTTKMLQGIFKGEISISTDLLEGAKFVLTVDQTKEEGTYVLDIVYNKANYGSLSINYALEDDPFSAKPSSSDEVITVSDEADLESYIADLDVEAFINNFLQEAKIDLTYEDIESLFSSATDSFADTYQDYDDYDDYYSDYDYDDLLDDYDDYDYEDYDYEDILDSYTEDL